MGETDGRFCLLSHGLYVEWKYDAEWFKSHVCAIEVDDGGMHFRLSWSVENSGGLWFL